MSNRLTEIAEEYGLVAEELIGKRLAHLQTKELNRLFDLLSSTLKDNNNESYSLQPSSFNFFVSSGMRGDRFCIHPGCRLQKIPLIERYAALYGDHLILPFRMDDSSRRDRLMSIETLFLSLTMMRPLVDAGIVLPIASSICVCKNCVAKVQDREDLVARIGAQAALKYSQEFEIVYEWRRDMRKHVFQIMGPEEFLGSPGVVRVFDQAPSWLPPGSIRGPIKLHHSVIKESGLIGDVFNTSAFDITMQATLAREIGCSYLSDSEAEAAFFDDPNLPSNAALSQSKFAESLMHDVPMFAELSTSAILDLRRENPESFSAYRSALLAATSSQHELLGEGPLRTQEFFRDVIEPRLDALRNLDVNSRRASIKTLGLSVAVPLVSLLFGILDQKLSVGLGEVAKLLGTAGLAKAIVDPVIDRTKKQTDVRSDPMFFLLRMDKKWKQQRQGCSGR